MRNKGESMRVIVRVRPENPKECKALTEEENTLISILDDQVLVFDPKVEDAPTYFHGQKVKFRDMTKRKSKDFKCVFDSVLNKFSTQQEVFEASALDVVRSVVEGYNGSVFAYGATGAGKTHTMLGSVDQPGVIYQTMVELFRLMEDREDTVFELGVSYMEIYNETIRDLFAPSGRPLPLREDEQGAVVIAGLSYHSPKSVRELYEMLLTGNQNRTQHPTDANAQSSRSHAIFQVYLRQRPVNSGTTTKFSLSKLSLIDLAGSERAAATTNRANRMREGANINRSLLALGNCINALAENKKNLHVPWRNSQLTRILKDCLGTNCKTCMIAAVSPSRLTFEDTFNTLKYALRAKSIKSQLKKETISVTEHVGKYQNIIETLRSENERLQSQISRLTQQLKQSEEKTTSVFDDGNESGSSVARREKRLSSVASRTILNAESSLTVKEILGKIKSIHAKRADLRKSMLQIESEEKQFKMSIHFLNQKKKLTEVFSADLDEKERRFCLLQRDEDEIQGKTNRLQAKKVELLEKMRVVDEEFARVWGEVATCERTEEAEFLQKELHTRRQMIEISDLNHQNQHLRSLTERQQHHVCTLNLKLLSIAHFLKSFFQEVLCEIPELGSVWTNKYESLQRAVLDDPASLSGDLQKTVPSVANFQTAVANSSHDSSDSLTGEKLEQIMDFTILKPISPKTPAMPKNPVCKTPFTGDKILSQAGKSQKDAWKQCVVEVERDRTMVATVTKKRKSPSPTPKQTARNKQYIWSKSQQAKSAVKQPRLASCVSQLSGRSNERGTPKDVKKKMSTSDRGTGGKSSGGFLTRIKPKQLQQSTTSSKNPALTTMDLIGRKRKQAADISSTSKTSSGLSSSVTNGNVSSRSSSTLSSSRNDSQVAKQFKKSVSSSLMPTTKAPLAQSHLTNKTSRSWSRRRSKTPSPVSRKASSKLVSRRDTFVKPDLENIFESQRNLALAEAANRRCTVAAPSHVSNRMPSLSRESRLRTSNKLGANQKPGFKPIPSKYESSDLVPESSTSGSFSTSELSIFGTATLDRLVDENSDPLHTFENSLHFDNESNVTVNKVTDSSSSLDSSVKDTRRSSLNTDSTFSFNTPDGKNDTFVKAETDDVFASDLDLESSRRSTLGHIFSNKETVAKALANYRRATLLHSQGYEK